MRVVVQRVGSASVRVDDEVIASIDPGDRQGLLLLVGLTYTDTPEQVEALAKKIWTLRILDGERSASDLDAPILAVSQFTLYADTAKGRRPSWSAAAPGSVAEPLFDHFCAQLRALGATVTTGRFGAHMRVSLINDGPVTILLEN